MTFSSKIRRKCQFFKIECLVQAESTQNFLQGYVSLAPRIPFLTVNQPFEITRLARQYDISSTFINNQELTGPLIHVTFKNFEQFSPYFQAFSVKMQRFYSSIGQKIDSGQNNLLSGTVAFRAYYAKTRRATCA